MGYRGAFEEAETPYFQLASQYLATGTTVTISRFALMSFTTDNNPTIEVTQPSSATSRSTVLGTAGKPYSLDLPYKNVANPYGNNKELSDVQSYLTVKKKRATWFLVVQPISGADITINIGDELVPSNVTGADGGVMARAASTITATLTQTAVQNELDENRRIVGRAWSRIHDYTLDSTDTTGSYSTDSRWLNGGPSLGVNELSAGTPFSSSTTTTKVGYVFGDLFT